MEPIEDYIINFLARRESPEDVESLKKWLDADPSRRDELKRWLVAWDAANMIEVAEEIDVERAYERFVEKEKINTSGVLKMNGIFKTVMRVAAVFVVGFLLGIFSRNYFGRSDVDAVAFVENIVPLGSQAEIRLADGSVVWLNAGSSLRYSSDFGNGQRGVYLSGEGYFVVEQGKAYFTVMTSQKKITVTGTEFNVRAYPDEDVVHTTLIRGGVLIEINGAEQPMLLQPGHKFSLSVLKDAVITYIGHEIAEAKASWREREWRIESMTLQDLAFRLNKRFDVSVYVDERVKDVHFSGTFIDETLEEILYVIRVATGVDYRVEGRSIFIE